MILSFEFTLVTCKRETAGGNCKEKETPFLENNGNLCLESLQSIHLVHYSILDFQAPEQLLVIEPIHV